MLPATSIPGLADDCHVSDKSSHHCKTSTSPAKLQDAVFSGWCIVFPTIRIRPYARRTHISVHLAHMLPIPLPWQCCVRNHCDRILCPLPRPRTMFAFVQDLITPLTECYVRTYCQRRPAIRFVGEEGGGSLTVYAPLWPPCSWLCVS